MADLKIADLQVYNGTSWQEFTDTDSAITTAYKCRNNIIYLENKTDLSEEDLQKQIDELKAQVGKKIPVFDLGNIGVLDEDNSLNTDIVGEKFVNYARFLDEDEIKVLLFSINDGNEFNNLEHKIVLICYGENPITYSYNGWGNLVWVELNKQTSGGGPTLIKYIFAIYLGNNQGGHAVIKLQGVPFNLTTEINSLSTTIDNLAKATPTDIKGDNGDSGDINTFHLKLSHDNSELTPQNPVLINIPKYLYIPTGSSVELNAGFDFPATEVNVKSGFVFFVIPLGSDESATGTVIDFVFDGQSYNGGSAGFYNTVEILYREDPTGKLRANITIFTDENFTSAPRLEYSGLPDVGNLEKITIDNTSGDYNVMVIILSSKINNDAINS